jgi:hypothetical protein
MQSESVGAVVRGDFNRRCIEEECSESSNLWLGAGPAQEAGAVVRAVAGAAVRVGVVAMATVAAGAPAASWRCAGQYVP